MKPDLKPEKQVRYGITPLGLVLGLVYLSLVTVAFGSQWLIRYLFRFIHWLMGG